jgi:hypothetical protein
MTLTLTPWRARIETALEHAGNLHNFEDVQTLLSQARLQAWVHQDSIVLTEIAELPSCRALHYFLAAGRLSDIVALRPEILRWAQAHGCTKEIMTGRPGWERVLRRLDAGWTSQVQMVRDL